MDFTCKTRAVSSFAKDVAKGRYNMHHKLQRQEDQWSSMQRGELLDSLLRSYPIDPIRCEVKEDGINYVFDGVQRSTNICNFISDGYKLPRALKPVIIDGTTVQNASLHNLSIMKEILGTPYVGQKIWVIKANCIIPQIVKAEKVS